MDEPVGAALASITDPNPHRQWAAAICGKDYADAIAGVSILIGTPTYGGQMTTPHAESIEAFAFVLGLLGAEFARVRPQKESLIQRARNRIVREFLKSKSTHLLFIDADVEFEPSAVMKLLEAKKDCVCAVYPRKQVEWNRVYEAMRAGYPNPEKHASSAVVNLRQEDAELGAVTYDDAGLCFPVMDAATGFLLISRGLLERMCKAYPETAYVEESDETRTTMHALFDCFIEDAADGTRRYLSEDWGFSRRVQKMGETVWLRPDVVLNHHGSFAYQGNEQGIVLDGGRFLDVKAAAE